MKRTGTQTYDLIVIGGGASGMMMAGRAGELGARVLLLERNKELGKKLKITGGGRCNITNAEFNVRTFLAHFPQAKEFLFSPFSQFSAKDTFTFFEKRSLPLVVEARKRAFPRSQKAIDVFRVLEKYVRKNSVRVQLDTRVATLKHKTDGNFSIRTSTGEKFLASNVAIATGGAAAPETGSTGDGFKLLRLLGHSINEPSPNIVPLKTDAKWVHALSGSAPSFVKLSFLQGDPKATSAGASPKATGARAIPKAPSAGASKVRIKKVGKVLFTHFGISGPLVLNSSYEVTELMEEGDVEARIDLFPDTDEGDLDRRVQNLFEKYKNKKMKNVLTELLPKSKKIAEALLAMPDINLTDKEVHSVTREERKALVKRMKSLTFPITGTLGFDKAVIADGGVLLKEVDFKHMTSRLYPNLYLLGDILNINRPSGGFSLQMCWTTGYVAGSDVGEKVKKVRKDR